MSDYELPELPSDEELGITDADREQFDDEVPDERPELSKDEMAALLGESERPASPSGGTKKGGRDGGDAKPPRPQVPEGPRSRWRGAVTLALLVGISIYSSTRTGLPRPVPANAADTAFSSARAMSTLVDIARMPHPIGSPEHARVRQLLVDRLRTLGLEPEIQTATAVGQLDGMVRAATVRNVVTRLPGTSPTGAVLITAHYDSRELSPGAADDGAGVVTILEAMRALRAGPPLRNDVIVLFSDGEEPCLCGAEAFVSQHPWMDDVSVVLNFEMRGGGGPSIMFETKEQNGWIVRALHEFDPRPFANSMSYEVYRRMPRDTDFTEYAQAGKQGLNFAAIDRAYVYHTPLDHAENLSEATLQHHGVHALAALSYLGNADLSSVDAPDAVYFTFPVLGLVVYPRVWVVPISGLLLALALLAWLSVRATGARISGISVGVGLSVLGTVLSFGFALWLRSWVTGYYAEAGSLPAAVLYSEGWWMLAAAAGAFFIVVTLHGLARRWLTITELALGAVVLPLGLAVWASFSYPLAAMNLQWPVAAALVSTLVLGLLGARRSGTVGWLTTVALTVPVLVLLEPIIELVWLAMTLRLIAVLGAAMAMALYLCLPAVDSLRHPNSWWAPLTGAVVAGATFGLAVSTSSSGVDRPAPSTLVYAYEHGTGSALWATDPSSDSVLDAEGLAWASDHAGSSFSRTRDMSDFGYPSGPTPVTGAPVIDVPTPQVDILRDTIEGPTRSVTLSVRSRLGAELLHFRIDPDSRTRLLTLNGAAIDQPENLQWAEHYGVPDSAGVVLELRMPADEPIGLHVVEEFLRPRELLGSEPFDRPADLVADANAWSDRAVFGYSVAAYADPRHAFMPGATRVEEPGDDTEPPPTEPPPTR